MGMEAAAALLGGERVRVRMQRKRKREGQAGPRASI